jgi:PhnB protein
MDKAKTMSRRSFAAGAASVTMAGVPRLRSFAARPIPNSNQDPGGGAMTTLSPYLLFDGNCEQAMEFYKSCFGGELIATRVKDSPARDSMPAFQHEKILNARLRSANVDLSASDWLRPDRTRIRGNSVCLYLSGGTFEELSAFFDRLSEGGKVTDPLTEQFFGAYGALNDKFDVRWMFHSNQRR